MKHFASKRGAPEWKADEDAVLNAQRVLPALIHKYFKAGRKLDLKSSATDMHGFRLKTKHLRYTLEAFFPIYGGDLEAKTAGLRPIQNALGDFNDCQVMLSELEGDLPDEVQAYIARRAEKLRKEFLRYWKEEFDAAGEDKKWEAYLAGPALAAPASATTPQA
jgi:CHAD domain-containing protein